MTAIRSNENDKAPFAPKNLLAVQFVLLFVVLNMVINQQDLKRFTPGMSLLSYGYLENATEAAQNKQELPKISGAKNESFLHHHSDEEYLLWLREARNRSLHLTVEEQPIKLLYRAMAGLGHQLLRMSAAYHFAMMYRIPRLHPTENPVCGGDIFTIYNHLIGEGQLMVDIPLFGDMNLFRKRSLFPLPENWPVLSLVNETLMSNGTRASLGHALDLINEVSGYSHVKFRWNFEAMQEIYSKNFYGKDLTDYQMYHQLMVLFEDQHKERIESVLKATKFEQHTVFALHVRAGNGESGDFKNKGRNIYNIDGWIKSVVKLMCDYREKRAHYFASKPLMIFVGTDTGSVVPKLQAASDATCQIPFVSAEQAYPEEGKSVSFAQKYKDSEKCLKGWEDMFLDMYFFTRCNSVLAGTYSSFTQAAPFSFVMHKAKFAKKVPDVHPHYFCDIGIAGYRMDCSATITEWMERKPRLTWGNQSMPEQRVRQELKFPHKFRNARNIESVVKIKPMI